MDKIETEYLNCFACGRDNPIGLHLQFHYENEEATAQWNCPIQYCGYPDVIHGGIISTILDEAMAKAILIENIVAVTGKMNVSFRAPLKAGTEILIIGKIEKNKGNVITASARIEDKVQVYAEANATYIRVGKS
ncbi:MAG: PaaI family thioesterase [Candidatus Cloacimonetes bacterium]|nr:PaaI family thioesterase [Candidatus Cloacimonadota bacterium]